MTMWELIKELKGCEVRYIEGVGSVGDSYRGYYDEFALEPDKGCITPIQELISYLEDEVVGEHFEGYKGGTYLMDYDTEVYLASYGSTGLLIEGVYVEDGYAKLRLKHNVE